jgi:uncharacterized protein YndB with AHSA1/START domain
VDEVSLRVAAPADELYGLITDVSMMGRWSPECTGGQWLGGANGPEVGARFKGRNKPGAMRWSTTCTVTKADPGRAFEWEVKQSGMRWGYRFEPDGDGTVVTEYRDRDRPAPLPVRLLLKTGVLGREREQLMVDGMKQTLDRLKDAAESRTEGRK